MKKFLPYIFILIALVGIFGISNEVRASDPSTKGTCWYHALDATGSSGPSEHEEQYTDTGCTAYMTVLYSLDGIIRVRERWVAYSDTNNPDPSKSGPLDCSKEPDKSDPFCVALRDCQPPKIVKNNECVSPPPAAEDPLYHFLAPLPCDSNASPAIPGCVNGQLTTFDPTSDDANNTKLGDYLNIMIRIFIGICAVLAVIMIVMGGIEYMTSELVSSKGEGKSKIKNAIMGLLLALGAYLILNTINPQLLNTDLRSIAKQDVTVAITTTTVPVNFLSKPEDIAEDRQNRDVLASNGIVAPPACANGVTKNCVNLNSLNDNTMVGVEALAAACKNVGCSVVITGGTEGGHAANGEHPDGSALDIRSDPKLDSFITKNTTPTACQTFPGPGGATYLWEVAGSTCGGPVDSSAPHWHVSYP